MSNYYTPCILRESAEGTVRIPIEDEMFQRREIQCVGEINRETVNAMILQLRYLQAQDDAGEITIFVNSPGGNVSDGLALLDTMAALRCPTRTVCMGMAASMGALIFASGNKRDIVPHARVMIHDPAHTPPDCTGHTIEEIYERTAQDTYFTAKEALEFGLADRIIHEI